MKLESARVGLAEDAVERQRVKVYVQIQAACRALNYRDRARPPVTDTVLARPARVHVEQDPRVHAVASAPGAASVRVWHLMSR